MRVSVVVITYNSGRWIEPIIARLTHPSIDLVFIDNNSADDTIDKILSGGESIRLVRSVENLGFARAANRAAKLCDADVLLFLNPDVNVLASQIVELGNLALNEGAVVSPVLDSSHKTKTVAAGLQPTLGRVFLHFSGLARLFGRFKPMRGWMLYQRDLRAGLIEVEWVSGGCLAVPRDTFFKVGGFCEDWFMYAEDIEFCNRVHQKGVPILLSGDVVVHHAIGESSSLEPGARAWNLMWVTNLADMYARYLSPGPAATWLWRCSAFVGLAARSSVSAVRRKGLPVARYRLLDIHRALFSSEPLH